MPVVTRSQSNANNTLNKNKIPSKKYFDEIDNINLYNHISNCFNCLNKSIVFTKGLFKFVFYIYLTIMITTFTIFTITVYYNLLIKFVYESYNFNNLFTLKQMVNPVIIKKNKECNYLPEEGRCAFNYPLSNFNPNEYYNEWIKKQTYIRIVGNRLDYVSPYISRSIYKENVINYFINGYFNYSNINTCNIYDYNNSYYNSSYYNSSYYNDTYYNDTYYNVNNTTIYDNKWISIETFDLKTLKFINEMVVETPNGYFYKNGTKYYKNITYIYNPFTLIIPSIIFMGIILI